MNTRHYILRLLLVFVCLFVLFSHSLTAYATDDEEISSFLGVEYPIIQQNSNIATFSSYDVSGYTVRLYLIDAEASHWDITGTTLDVTDPEVYYAYGDRILLYYDIIFPDFVSTNSIVNLEMMFHRSVGTVAFHDFRGYELDMTRIDVPYDKVTEAHSTTPATRFIFDGIESTGSLKRIRTYFWYTPGANVTEFTSELKSIVVTDITEKGLFANILEGVKNIITGITELPSKIASSISGFFDNVVNAVVNLGTAILDGIKNLFIPSEEDITNMKDKWDTLLSDRFGALYQVGALISDYAAAFTEQSKGTITFPSVTIPLAGAEFTFGGWEVQVVPDGFGIVFDTLKLITSILATLLFANGLKKRFDKLLGGADDI